MKPHPGNHGTTGGYQAHRRRGEKACSACLEAKAQESARYKAQPRPPHDPRGGIPRCPMHTSTAYRDAQGPYSTAIGQCVLDQGHPGQHLTPPNRPDDQPYRP